jgi:hypothetical protein
MDHIRIRRRLRRQHQRSIAEMQPLQFTTDSVDIDVHTVSVFDDHDGSVAIAFVTGRGTVTVTLPPHLAAKMANGVHKLVWQRLALPRRCRSGPHRWIDRRGQRRRPGRVKRQ